MDPRNALASASPNFGFLEKHDPRLLQAAAAAERYVFDDPVTSLMRLRQFGELLAECAANRSGLQAGGGDSQFERLRRLSDVGILSRDVAHVFHSLRKAGNDANHAASGTRRDALAHLRLARTLAIWFHRTFGLEPSFKAGPFVPPPNPAEEDALVQAELERLRSQLAEARGAVEAFAHTAAEQEALRREAELNAAKAYEDLEAALELAEESAHEAAQARDAQSRDAREEAEPVSSDVLAALIDLSKEAGETLDLDESATRLLIDEQLRAAGWEADTEVLRHSLGVRPAKGRYMAIAEWPTQSGPADYVLFAGLTPVAVVEAKRQRKDVAGAIEQAKRYSRDYVLEDAQTDSGGPWGEFRVPFLFATNGRPFLRQLRMQSGIWFLDARESTNHPRPLEAWYTPAGLQALLRQDLGGADAKLAREPFDYLPLRGYQREAVSAVEAAIADGRQDMMLAMATGTGKTRLALGLIYRLVKAGRFRRILFLVDRTSLGEQAHGVFQTVQLEQMQSFSQIYDMKGLGDLRPDPDTRLHVATIQGMIKRLIYDEDGDGLPVDAYDCILVDECHRGYNLDQEMSDSELEFRSETEYISKYRRVLDHFDATRIGLTATPALHTTEIFGPPIFEYGYRQAVIDGYLVDHEPPIRILTRLNQDGIHWQTGETVGVYNTATAELRSFQAQDEIDIDVAGFNTAVLTENFNRAVCEQLAAEIDPALPGKTLVYCATDSHADLVTSLLKEAFEKVYGPVEDDAVMKITGAAEKPLQRIRHYKTERLPNVAVTVDLLTTGVDVPEITNLVFIRRVKSRILYDQMMGRATRLCPEIDKDCFRIFDAVDLYAALAPYTDMKPIVTRPNVTVAQMVEELRTVTDSEHKRLIMDQLTATMQSKKRRLKGEHAQTYESLAEGPPDELISLLRGRDAARAIEFFDAHPQVAGFLDRFKLRPGRTLLVSGHDDEPLGLERGYGDATKPEDYLTAFRQFVESHKNALDALTVVLTRPRDLTRQQLRELRTLLDNEGYSEKNLETAYAEVSNQKIAASIIGYIRQQALGSPLVPYEQRVDAALTRVLASRSWSSPQRRWLERIGKQLKVETVVDREALDRGQFKQQGGFNRLNKVFDGKLEQVLGDLQEELWRDAG